MKIIFIVLGMTTMCVVTSSYALQNADNLKQVREQVTKQYISDLQKADYKDITQLFEKNWNSIFYFTR